MIRGATAPKLYAKEFSPLLALVRAHAEQQVANFARLLDTVRASGYPVPTQGNAFWIARDLRR